jgi:hypothetical protein
MKTKQQSPVQRQRLSMLLRSELVERLRDAAFWTPGATLAGLVDEAITKALDQMEKRRGEPFPPRKGQLKAGRPMTKG